MSETEEETTPGIRAEELLERARDAVSALIASAEHTKMFQDQAAQAARAAAEALIAGKALVERDAQTTRAAADAAKAAADEAKEELRASEERDAKARADAPRLAQAEQQAREELRAAEGRLATMSKVADAARSRAGARNKALEEAMAEARKAAERLRADESKLADTRRTHRTSESAEQELGLGAKTETTRRVVTARLLEEARAASNAFAEAAARAALESREVSEKAAAANQALIESKDPAVRKNSARFSAQLLQELALKAEVEEKATADAARAAEELTKAEAAHSEASIAETKRVTSLKAALAAKEAAEKELTQAEKAVKDSQALVAKTKELAAKLQAEAKVALGVERMALQNEVDGKAEVDKAAAAVRAAVQARSAAAIDEGEREDFLASVRMRIAETTLRFAELDKVAVEAEERFRRIHTELEELDQSAGQAVSVLNPPAAPQPEAPTPEPPTPEPRPRPAELALLEPDGAQGAGSVPVATVTRVDDPTVARPVGEAFQIGKDTECDLPLKGWFAPRKAAVIVRGEFGWSLINVSPSPAAVLVNGAAVAGLAPLKDGDKLDVHGELFTFGARRS